MSKEPITLQSVQTLLASDRRVEAANALRQLLRREPHAHGANLLAAQLAFAEKDHELAARHARAALDAAPNDLRASRILASSLAALDRPAEAVQVYEAMLAREPGNEQIMMALSGMYLRIDRLAAAEAIMERAVKTRGDLREVWHEYAVLFLGTGRAADAISVLEQALVRIPASSDLAVTLASVSNYVPGLDPARVRAAHARAARRLEPDIPLPAHSNSRDPERRLIVGFVSGDFHNHSISYFLLPLLENLNRERMRPELFWTGRSRDATTERFMSLAPLHTCTARAPSEIARDIRAMGVDVLIDLSGYTMDHGLPVFALRAAPVQLSAIGYPASTGLRSIQARIGDSITDPPGSSESDPVVRLDPCFLCYQPPVETPEPCLDDPSRPPTFGSFNAIQKLNPELLTLWAGLMRSVPDSRLVLKADLRLTSVVSRIRNMFKSSGVDPDRLTFLSNTRTPQEARALYSRIDVALDTYPYNGTTTTCESLWMGVPVVARLGATHVQRVSASLLHATGLPDLVATSTDSYLEIARNMVLDRDRVLLLRRTLRDQMRGSVLCDAPGYARRFEEAIREVWRHWCTAQRSADGH